MDEIKEATGIVTRINQRGNGYGIVLDNQNDVWYNGFKQCPYEEEEKITIRYKDKNKDGKIYHNILKDGEKILKKELETHGDPGDFEGADELTPIDGIVGEGAMLLGKCYAEVESIIGHKPADKEIALVSTLFILSSKHYAVERWLRSKDEKKGGIADFV